MSYSPYYDNGAAFGMEPDALATAYARAVAAESVQQPRSGGAGSFRGMAQAPRRRAAPRARSTDGAAAANDGPFGGAPRRRTQATRAASPLTGGFAALRILNEQTANPTA